MKKKVLVALLCITMIVPSMGQSGQQKKKYVFETALDYLLFLPKDYSKSGKPSPLIIFLHGSGERGSDLEKVKAWGPPAIVEANPDFPFMVVSPQCPEGQWWNVNVLKGMIDDILKTYNVDKSRVYLTGLSMGGYGAWELSTAFPEYFAAVAPVCGGGNPLRAKRLKDIPVWVFHGKKDTAVPEQQSAEMVEALKNVGGNVEYTVLPEGEHADAWKYAYGQAGLFDWFLKQVKK